MYTVVDENELVKKYNWSSLITEQDNLQAISVIEQLVANGNYFTNSPRYQTNVNLFQRTEPCWLKFRLSFLFSVFMYLGKEARVAEMMAWSYMTNLDTEENRDQYWHTHNNNQWKTKMSGVWYLRIPDDVRDRDYTGTEFAPNGVDSDGKFFVKPADLHWVIFPGSVWHRPGIIQSDKYRFVLAADVEYQI